jgi:glycosyltransferase involved in cell wall biosynthesis
VTAAGPLVSVLMPVYRAAGTLGLALASLRRQSLDDWECVLVLDGADERTRELSAAAAAADSRITLLEQEHRGIVVALNAGITTCRGRYVARMDADDVMHRLRLERQVAALEQDAALAGVGCHVRLFPRSGLRAGLRAYEGWLNSIRTSDAVRSEAFVECPLAHPSLTLKRDVLARFGYRDCDWPEDYDLVLRLLGAGHSLGVVPERLLGWRDHTTRLSRTGATYGLDRFVRCKAHFLARDFLPAGGSYVLWGYGDTGRLLSRALADCGFRPSHIIEVHPGRIGQIIAGAPVIAPEALAVTRLKPIVVSVAGQGPRSEVRRALSALRYRESVDFVCAA